MGLFAKRSYSVGPTIALFYFAGFTGIFFIFTLYLQSGLSYTPLMAGLAITPFALGSASAAVVGGRLVTRAGRRVVATGLTTVIVGLAATMAATLLVPGPGVALATALPLLVAGLGSGLVISPNQAITLSEVPPEGGGSAAGVLQTGPAPRLRHRHRRRRLGLLRLPARGLADRLQTRPPGGGPVRHHRPHRRPVRPDPHPHHHRRTALNRAADGAEQP